MGCNILVLLLNSGAVELKLKLILLLVLFLAATVAKLKTVRTVNCLLVLI